MIWSMWSTWRSGKKRIGRVGFVRFRVQGWEVFGAFGGSGSRVVGFGGFEELGVREGS